MLNVSFDEITNALTSVGDLLYDTNDPASEIYHAVKLGGYALDSVYIMQAELEKAYYQSDLSPLPWALGYPSNSDDIQLLNCNGAIENDGAGSQDDKETPTLLKEQQDNILKAINALKLEPMAIPNGQKKVIQRYCENEYAESFKGSTCFDRAWDKGKKELWKMKHHDSYARRGNN